MLQWDFCDDKKQVLAREAWICMFFNLPLITAYFRTFKLFQNFWAKIIKMDRGKISSLTKFKKTKMAAEDHQDHQKCENRSLEPKSAQSSDRKKNCTKKINSRSTNVISCDWTLFVIFLNSLIFIRSERAIVISCANRLI
jgi:hypothetical protein